MNDLDAKLLTLIQLALMDYEMKYDAISVMNWMLQRVKTGLQDDLDDLVAAGKIVKK
jgi:hypothetical protein